MATDKVLATVLKEIKPTKEEEKHVKELANRVTSALNKKIKDAEAVVGGSVAKGTWLRSNKELDIFVMFDYDKYKESKDLSEILEKALKQFKGVKRLHGSRDYFQFPLDGFTVELIPIIKIKKAEDAPNTTDVSLLHIGWVKKNVKNGDDIRLLKQFAQAQNVYGAESHIHGFSGYVLEILTIHYGGFLKTVRGISKWGEKKAIDINKAHRNVYFSMNKSKLESPLVLVDPVDDKRNAAASLSLKNYRNLINKCRAFLRKPSKEFFEIKPFDIEKLKKRKFILIVEAAPLEGKSDVVGCKLIKAHDYILSKLNEFSVKQSGWAWDEGPKAYLWYMLESYTISKTKEVMGPPVEMKEHAAVFKKKYSRTKVKSGKLVATVKREYTDARDLIKSILRDAYLKDKAKRMMLQ